MQCKIFHRYIRVNRLLKSYSSQISPSTKTTIKLNSLPISSTITSLKDSLKDISLRKIEMEPGCVLHFCNEAQAEFCKLKLSKLENGSNFDCRISSTVMPCILIKNVPTNVYPSDYFKDFKDVSPIYYQYFSAKEILFVAKDAKDSLHISKLLSSIDDVSLESLDSENRIVKLPDNTYAVSVPIITSACDLDTIKQKLISSIPQEQIQSVSVTNKSDSTLVRIRNNLNENTSALNLSNVLAKHEISHQIRQLSRPALIIRNIDNDNDKELHNVIKQLSTVVHIQQLSRVDNAKGSILLHFQSENSALEAMKVLRNVSGGFQHKRVSVSYKDISEPAIKISNIAASNCTVTDIKAVLKSLEIAASITEDQNQAVLISLLSPVESQRVVAALRSRYAEISIEEVQNDDIGIECFSMTDSKTQSLVEELKSLNIDVKSVSEITNRSLYIGFANVNQANMAKKLYYDKLCKLKEADACRPSTADISCITAYALEIFGLSADVSVKSLIESLSLDYKVLKADRCAIVKVKRHLEIVPTMKKLKTVQVDGSNLSPSRYYPLSSMDSSNVTEYDTFENPGDEDFDKFSLRKLLKDYMHTDPATRYHIARNAFERQLADAKGASKIDILLDSSLSSRAREEASDIINKLKFDDEGRILPNQESVQRLFELYLQRDDMALFLNDFKDYQASLGEPVETDTFNWAKFQIATNQDIEDYQETLSNQRKEIRRQSSIKNSNSPSEVVIESEDSEEEDTVVSLEDPSILKDKDGRVWAGAILDTDTVQKPMPGNRVVSHRALVVVGNLRGTAGFGVGKSKTAADAIKAAFRDALRNLVHIDLYDNFGFAHNLYGKHNSCHVYINSTPRERSMVASPFASEVFSCFGISSASCKVIGRRNPYSVIRAMFNAIQKHENIDETAKQRGLRYLTLRSAFQNKH